MIKIIMTHHKFGAVIPKTQQISWLLDKLNKADEPLILQLNQLTNALFIRLIRRIYEL